MPSRLAVIALALAACTQTPTPAAETTSAVIATTTVAPSSTTTVAPTASTSTTIEPTTTTSVTLLPLDSLIVESFPVPEGSRPHDVAPATDGGVWYTAQGSGELGWLDPASGETRHIPLGAGSRPHGVIVDGDGVPWITDGGLNAIVEVDPDTFEVRVYPLPDDRPGANLNTATFDHDGILWFTGQSGLYGSLDPATSGMAVYDAPGGRGPYGIATAPAGSVFYASLAGSHIAVIGDDGSAEIIEPPTAEQGARRVWPDSTGAIWVSEWNSGNLSRYSPDEETWDTWPLPGSNPAAYAVFVDDADIVWVSDFGSNSIVRFDPQTETFTTYPLPHDPGDVRQILGRPGEVWGAESAADHLILIRTR